MMRSLYSGVAGLKTHQTKMDVIGNNIANVNTVGFKSSNVTFQDVLYQTTQSATGSNAANGVGGTNAKQIGLGSTVSSISTSITSNGSAQSTNNPYDLMLKGDAFFVVSRGGINYFTKVGAFKTDDLGYLVTSAGEQVMGWVVPDGETDIRKDTVQSLQLESAKNKYSAPEATMAAYASGNIDKTDETFKDGGAKVMNVTIYDKEGYSYNVKMNITQKNTTGKNEYTVSIADITDSNNKSILSEDVKASIGTDSDLIYNADTGAFISVGGKDALTLSITSDAFEKIDIDFSSTTMYATTTSTIKLNRGDSQGIGGGRKVGTLTDVSIKNDGKIYGIYDNGDNKLLGQIAVAQFTNPAGLEAIGGSLYQQTQNSGSFDGIGQEVTEGGGKMTQGVLEMSNVDLSAEFTDMIVTQRGFQANSRIITVSDTMIEELVNLKR